MTRARHCNICHDISDVRYVFLYSLGSHEDCSWSAISCYLYDLLCITVPQMFHTASNWLTLGKLDLVLFVIQIKTINNVNIIHSILSFVSSSTVNA